MKNNFLAQASNPFGTINPPANRFGTLEGGGLGKLISLFTGLLIMGAAIYALFNFILAGYAFMSADNDPGKIQGAWAKIYQTIIGLAFAGGAFVIAGIVGQLLFQDWTALTNFSLSTPTAP